MRKLLLLCLALLSFGELKAQVHAGFDDLLLSQQDTFYVNYSDPGNDVGFTDGNAYFQCVYDTAFGGLWQSGFAYSNMTDSTTSGYENQYSAKTARGENFTSSYAVFWQGYGSPNKIIFPLSTDTARPNFYFDMWVTNSTYAYNSMRDGDFIAKKFGGPTGNDSDWFKLTIRGYVNGQLKSDSVEVYLADFRFANNSQDYILKHWQRVNLLPLITGSGLDSMEFVLSSSDNDPQYGMNTPAYVCIDNMVAYVTNVPNISHPSSIAKVYPNPATAKLFVELRDKSITNATLYNLNGQMVGNYSVNTDKLEINTANLPVGSYMLVLKGMSGQATVRFVKQ